MVRHKYSSIFTGTQKSCTQMTPACFQQLSFTNPRLHRFLVLLLKCRQEMRLTPPVAPSGKTLPDKTSLSLTRRQLLQFPHKLVCRGVPNTELNRLNSAHVFSKQRDFVFSCRLRWRNGQLQSPGLLNSQVKLHHYKTSCKKKTKNPGIFPLKHSSIILSSCLPDTTEVGFCGYITMQTGHAINP